MDHAEFLEWAARESFDPLPDPWLQTGQVCSSVLAPYSRHAIPPGDFVPHARVRPRRQTPDQIRDAFTLIGKSIHAQES